MPHFTFFSMIVCCVISPESGIDSHAICNRGLGKFGQWCVTWVDQGHLRPTRWFALYHVFLLSTSLICLTTQKLRPFFDPDLETSWVSLRDLNPSHQVPQALLVPLVLLEALDPQVGLFDYNGHSTACSCHLSNLIFSLLYCYLLILFDIFVSE